MRGSVAVGGAGVNVRQLAKRRYEGLRRRSRQARVVASARGGLRRPDAQVVGDVRPCHAAPLKVYGEGAGPAGECSRYHLIPFLNGSSRIAWARLTEGYDMTRDSVSGGAYIRGIRGLRTFSC
jgi:hypothetical protein